jgi:hypothetical protein
MLSLRCGPSLPGTVLPTQRMKKAPPNLQLSSAALCMPALNLSTWGSVRAGYGSTVPSYADPSAYAGRRPTRISRESLPACCRESAAIDAQATTARGMHTHAIGCLVRRARWCALGREAQASVMAGSSPASPDPSQSSSQQPGFLQDTSVQALRQREAHGTTLPLDDGAAAGLRPG